MKHAFLAMALLMATPAHAETSNVTVEQWTQQALPALLDITPQTFDAQKEHNRALLTKKGHAEFYKAMDRARIPQSLESSSLIAKVRKICVTDIKPPPAPKQPWVVKADILYDYMGHQKINTNKQSITVMIEESQGNDGATKLAVAQYIAVPGNQYDFKCTDGAADPHAARKKEIRDQINKLEDELRSLGEGSEADSLR